MEPRNFKIMETDLSLQSVPAKKSYQKPEMIYLAPLEAMAVICVVPGKSGTGCLTLES
jgi:hypothetical protein